MVEMRGDEKEQREREMEIERAMLAYIGKRFRGYAERKRN